VHELHEQLQEDEDEGLPGVQLGSKEKLPRKEVALGLVLLFLGMLFFLLAHLHNRGHTREHIKEGSVCSSLASQLQMCALLVNCTDQSGWIAFLDHDELQGDCRRQASVFAGVGATDSGDAYILARRILYMGGLCCLDGTVRIPLL